jgi:hypothetical protein
VTRRPGNEKQFRIDAANEALKMYGRLFFVGLMNS